MYPHPHPFLDIHIQGILVNVQRLIHKLSPICSQVSQKSPVEPLELSEQYYLIKWSTGGRQAPARIRTIPRTQSQATLVK